MLNLKIKTKNIFCAALATSLFFGFSAFASETEGSVDSTYRYIFGENIGWLDFGAENSNVVVTDEKITGYAYGENIGWISLSCENDDSCEDVNYGIANDGEGDLSGYAYGENIGWIDFEPENGGVWIDSDGYFYGYAFGENIGWITFGCLTTGSCQEVDYGLRTDWRPLSTRENESEEVTEEEEEETGEKNGLDVSDVEYSSTSSTITITWETDVKADSYIRYGINKNLSKIKKDSEREKKHSVTLKNLRPATTYYFRITSEDEDGNYERTKIYSTRTEGLPSPMIFAPVYQTAAKPDPNDYESLEIGIEENIEDKKGGDDEESLAVKEESNQTKEIQEEDAGNEKGKGSGFFASVGGFFGKISTGIGNSFLAVADFSKNSVISLQKKISGKIASLKKEGQELKEKEEIAKDIARHYIAKVYKKQEKKLVSAVKFRILDQKNNPIANLETRLFSDPKLAITDEKGVAIFNDVEIGEHELEFSHQGEDFSKKVSIADTATEQGIISAEIIDIKAEKTKIAVWMWLIIFALATAIFFMIYFAKKYFDLKRSQRAN